MNEITIQLFTVNMTVMELITFKITSAFYLLFLMRLHYQNKKNYYYYLKHYTLLIEPLIVCMMPNLK